MCEEVLNKVEIERITNSKSASTGGGGADAAVLLSGRDKNYSAGLKESLHGPNILLLRFSSLY